MNSNKILLTFLITAILCVMYTGCGDDSTNTTTTPTGPPPSIRMTPGSTYDFTYDSLISAQPNIRLPRQSHDVVQAQIVFDGKTCFPVLSTTTDTVTHQVVGVQTAYFTYDSAGGKFYQYGISALINPLFATPTWDVVADFTVSQGTSWTVGQVNYTIMVAGTNYNFTGPLTSKIAEKTTIVTTGTGQTVDCYRIELLAHISATTNGVTASADIIVDYYLGYSSTASNPAGLLEAKLRPFNFIVSGIPVPQNGDDRKLKSFTIAP